MSKSEHRSRRHYVRQFWHVSDGIRRSVREDEANELEIQVRNGPYSNSMTFDWPRDRIRSQDLERMLQSMFDRGVSAAKGELRSWLGA